MSFSLGSYALFLNLKQVVYQNISLILFHNTIICITIVFLEDVTTFYSRTYAFQYSFFPSTILKCNKLERKIRQSLTVLIFRNSLLNIGGPVSKPGYNI